MNALIFLFKLLQPLDAARFKPGLSSYVSYSGELLVFSKNRDDTNNYNLGRLNNNAVEFAEKKKCLIP